MFWKLARTNDSASEIGFGAAIGTFISVFPTFGFGTPLVLLLSRFIKFNLLIAIAASIISNPFTSPFFLYLSYKMGVIITGNSIDYKLENWSSNLGKTGITLFIGSLIISGIVAVLSYFISTAVVKSYRNKR
ncbi:Domain of unknown function DUF2062 [Flavobacteriaceae bacterium]